MTPFQPIEGVDLTALDDETLVVLIKECGYRPAEEVLMLRYQETSNRWIRQLARQRDLAPADVEDAMQDAVFGLLKAVARYDTAQIGKMKGCTFYAFLRRVVSDRFKDFVKSLWRYQNRYRRSLYYTEDGEEGASLRVSEGLHTDAQSDPAEQLERQELLRKFRELVDELDETGKRLIERLLSGERLRDIAEEMNISYDAAKRRRRQVLSKLADRLGA